MPKNNGKEEDWSWVVAPVIGLASLVGMMFLSQNNHNNHNNNLPPPPSPSPNNKKQGGCGCNGAKK